MSPEATSVPLRLMMTRIVALSCGSEWQRADGKAGWQSDNTPGLWQQRAKQSKKKIKTSIVA